MAEFKIDVGAPAVAKGATDVAGVINQANRFQVDASIDNLAIEKKRGETAVREAENLEIAKQRAGSIRQTEVELTAEAVRNVEEQNAVRKQLLEQNFKRLQEDDAALLQYQDKLQNTSNPLTFLVTKLQQRGREKFREDHAIAVHNLAMDIENARLRTATQLQQIKRETTDVAAVKNFVDLQEANKTISTERAQADAYSQQVAARLAGADQKAVSQESLYGFGEQDKQNYAIRYMNWLQNGGKLLDTPTAWVNAKAAYAAQPQEQAQLTMKGAAVFEQQYAKYGGELTGPAHYAAIAASTEAGVLENTLSWTTDANGRNAYANARDGALNAEFTRQLEQINLDPQMSKLTADQKKKEAAARANRSISTMKSADLLDAELGAKYQKAAETVFASESGNLDHATLTRLAPALQIPKEIQAFLDSEGAKKILNRVDVNRAGGDLSRKLDLISLARNSGVNEVYVADALARAAQLQVEGHVQAANPDVVTLKALGGKVPPIRLKLDADTTSNLNWASALLVGKAGIKGEAAGYTRLGTYNPLDPADLVRLSKTYEATRKQAAEALKGMAAQQSAAGAIYPMSN